MTSATTHTGGPSWVVVDVETTGLSPREHRIVELAVVILDQQGRSLGEASTLLDPGGDLGSVEAHGIRPEHLEGAPRFAAIAGWLQSWLAGKVVVGHNLLFTTAFLDEEYRRIGIEMPHVPVICTMTHAPRYLPSLPGRTLEQCCAAAGIPIEGPRSALSRARAASDLFARFLSHRETLPSPWVDNLEKAKRLAWPHTPVRDFPLVRRPEPVQAAEPVREIPSIRATRPVAASSPVRFPVAPARPDTAAAAHEPGAAPEPADAAAKPRPRPSPRPRASAKVADDAPSVAGTSVAGTSAGDTEPTDAEQKQPDARQEQADSGQDQAELVVEMVDNAPRQPGESDTVATYLGAIDNAVSDRLLSFTEAIHLKDLASALAIFEAEQAEAHRTYLRTLASTAWTDHQLTEAERDDLLVVGKLLEVPEHEVDEAIADTMPRRSKRAAATASASASVPQTVTTSQVAAWYADPYGESQLRWWDGSSWTAHVHD